MESNGLKQAMIAFAFATSLVVFFGLLARGSQIVNSNLGALVAFVFIGVTVYAAKRQSKDLLDFGYHTSPLLRSLVIACLYVALIFPVFALGFVFFYELVCARGSELVSLAPPGICMRFVGWGGAQWPSLGWTTVELAFVQLIVIALPEELFFRGFIHELCERSVPPRRRFLGGGVGWALVASSAFFAFGHLAVTFDVRRLVVFFPGLLFGWMRSATGSILAGTIAHAASNLFIHILEKILFSV